MRSLFLFFTYTIVLVALIATHRREGLVTALSDFGWLDADMNDECIITFPSRLYGGETVYGCEGCADKEEGQKCPPQYTLSLSYNGILSLVLDKTLLWSSKSGLFSMRRSMPRSDHYFAEIRNDTHLVIGANDTVIFSRHLTQCKRLLSRIRLNSQPKNHSLASIIQIEPIPLPRAALAHAHIGLSLG